MFKNYLKVAIRNLRKDKIFSTINILGLALGMTCSLLILLWVNHEKSIDTQYSNRDRLYRLYERQYHDGQIDAGYMTPGVLAGEIKNVIPEIEYATANAWEDDLTFQVGDKILKKKGNYASPDYFKIFSIPLVQGSPETAIKDPLDISISRNMANDFFGSPQAAIGKAIRMQNRLDLRISSVFENFTAQNSQQFECLVNWQTFLDMNEWAKDWGNNGPATYVVLRKDAKPENVRAKLKDLIKKYDKNSDSRFKIELDMQRNDQVYLNSNFDKSGTIDGGRIEYVRLFTIVAIFILLIACINFMNLTTARSLKRSKEIGIRKVVGAVRLTLIRQFFGEAIMISFFALVIAIVLTMLLLAPFNQITGKQIHIPYGESWFWVGLLGLTLITGILSGSYPAIFLSAFRPIRVLKGAMKFSMGATWFRKGLVVFQFVLSIILIIGTIVVSKQINYVQSTNLGYNRENMVYVDLEGDLTAKYTLFKQEASKLSGIKDISRITQNPTDISNGTGGVDWEGKDPNSRPQFTQAGVGYDYVKTMKLQLIAGRDFSKDFASDSAGYIINEAAAKLMGMKDPVNKPITFWQQKGTIVGVLKDFHYQSLHEPIRPLVLRLMEKNGWGLAVARIEAGKTKQGLANLEKICKELNPKFPFTYKFMDEEYQKLYQSEQVVGKLSNSFAGIAILISCLGLLGLAMFTAEQRTKEFGIRKVLGASIHSLFTLLSRDFLLLVFIAFVIAAPVAWLVMQNWLRDFQYRTSINWWVFAVAGSAALLVALFTISFQAIKAAFANPVKSLRTE